MNNPLYTQLLKTNGRMIELHQQLTLLLGIGMIRPTKLETANDMSPHSSANVGGDISMLQDVYNALIEEIKDNVEVLTSYDASWPREE